MRVKHHFEIKKTEQKFLKKPLLRHRLSNLEYSFNSIKEQLEMNCTLTSKIYDESLQIEFTIHLSHQHSKSLLDNEKIILIEKIYLEAVDLLLIEAQNKLNEKINKKEILMIDIKRHINNYNQ